jgi:hypothetical protein
VINGMISQLEEKQIYAGKAILAVPKTFASRPTFRDGLVCLIMLKKVSLYLYRSEQQTASPNTQIISNK